MAAFDLATLPGLQPDSFTPLYVQLADRLTDHIRTHRLAPETLLPSEAECMSYFGVSRLTVRQAMGRMVAAGLVHRARGRGTFVAERPIDQHLGATFEENMIEAQLAIEFKLLAWAETDAPDEVAEALGLQPGARVYRLERLRLADGKPIGIEIRFVPAALGARVRQEDLHQRPLYLLLQDASGKKFAHIQFTVGCFPASARDARLLGTRRGRPMVYREHTYFTEDDTPLVHGIAYFLGDRYRFHFETGRRLGGEAIDYTSVQPHAEPGAWMRA